MTVVNILLLRLMLLAAETAVTAYTVGTVIINEEK